MKQDHNMNSVNGSQCVGNGKKGKSRARKKQRVPRGISLGVSIIRRVVNVNVPRPAVDGGFQFGTVPSTVLDWASLQAIFGRYRILQTRLHFLTAGEYDATPAYPTFWVYHDLVSVGAPATLPQAFQATGVKSLEFNASHSHRTFSYVPLTFTSSGFQTQVPSTQMYYQTSAAFAPTFSSVAAWGANYNNISAAAPLTLLTEFVMEFSQPI